MEFRKQEFSHRRHSRLLLLLDTRMASPCQTHNNKPLGIVLISCFYPTGKL
jgi:hypothetical protein